MAEEIVRMRQKYGTAAQWLALAGDTDLRPKKGEWVFLDTGNNTFRVKIGNGIDDFEDLPFFSLVENVGLSEILTNRDLEESAGSWRPIYQKNVDYGALPDSTTSSVAHSVASISRIAKISGVASSVSGSTLPLPFASASLPITMSVSLTDIIISTNTTRSTFNGYITLEYTKTTDTPTATPRNL